MADSRLKIRMGEIEVAYHGSEQFLKSELPLLLSEVVKLYQESGIASKKVRENVDNKSDNVAVKPTGHNGEVGTTANIAAQLNCDSGPELAVAAATRLMLGDGKEKFSRKELLAEMQTATSYYMQNYSSNLTRILGRLIRSSDLREVAQNTYSLSAQKLEDVKRMLNT